MSCETTDRPVPLSTALAYARKAFEKGKAKGEESVLHGLRTVGALNGSGLRVLKTIKDAAGHEHGDDGKFAGSKLERKITANPRAALRLLMASDNATRTYDWENERPAREYDALVASLARLPAEKLEAATAEVTAGWEDYKKLHGLPADADLDTQEGLGPSAFRQRLKILGEAKGGTVEKAATFVESEHPRDRTGIWIPKGDIDHAAGEMAKGNHAPADKLREIVWDRDSHILEDHLAHPGRPDSTHRTAQTGVVRNQRDVGESHGEHVGAWLKAAEHVIRHSGEYDHAEIASAIRRATAHQTPHLKRVLLALEPEVKLSHQPTTKEGLKARIREVMDGRIKEAKADHLRQKLFEKESKEKELQEHATTHALKVHDARERLHRFESWARAEPSDSQASSAVQAAREYVARLLGHDVAKAFAESEHPRGQPENAGEFAKGDGGGKADGESAPESKPADSAADYKKHGVRAAAFKAWFGDWENEPGKASKVVGKDGSPAKTYRPVAVYHGTKSKFDAFDPERLGTATGNQTAKLGFFFSSSPAVAKDFADGGEVVAAYLNIRNPYVMQAAEWRRLFITPFEGGFNEAAASAVGEFKKNAIAKGHDGLLLQKDPKLNHRLDRDHEYANDSWVAFHPTQIKAVDNAGTFDPSDPSIRKAEASLAPPAPPAAP